MHIENYYNVRNKFLIKNEYQLLKNSNDEFHHVIYFLSDNKIEIIIRKLSNDDGWNYDLKIKILFNNVWKTISIGSSEDNFKIIEIYVNDEIEVKDIKKLYYIPKKIIQTNTSICKNLSHYNTVMSIIEKNPSYEYQFFNDIEMRNFIKDNFIVNILDNSELNNDIPDILKSFDLLKCGALKADLFRYCYLYIHGGIYIDSKVSNIVELDNIINEDDKNIICLDDAKNSLYNGIMIMDKNNFKLLQLLQEIIVNIQEQHYLQDIHEPTGNKIYYKYFKDESFRLNKRANNVYMNNSVIFKCDYKNYYKNDYQDFRVNYVKRDYYYYYNFYVSNYIFSFSNDIKNKYIFSIFNLKDNIFVIKNNSDNGWDIHFKINVYNTINNENKVISIYKNNESEFVFTV
tara:strand:+ start:4763 stop:5965 length:1203 start_codon:yes stop_codon:yes gene_type:complete